MTHLLLYNVFILQISFYEAFVSYLTLRYSSVYKLRFHTSLFLKRFFQFVQKALKRKPFSPIRSDV